MISQQVEYDHFKASKEDMQKFPWQSNFDKKLQICQITVLSVL